METALVRFVGAGVTSISAGLGFFVPSGAINGGFNAIVFLTRQGNQRTASLLTEIVRDLMTAWRQSGLPTNVAAEHLHLLPQIMDRYRPDVDMLVGALAVAGASSKSGRMTTDLPARRVASEIVSRARAERAFETMGVNEAVAYFFLDRLFARLLLERSYLEDISPVLDVYFYKSLWKGSLAANPGSPIANVGEIKAREPGFEPQQGGQVAAPAPIARPAGVATAGALMPQAQRTRPTPRPMAIAPRAYVPVATFLEPYAQQEQHALDKPVDETPGSGIESAPAADQPIETQTLGPAHDLETPSLQLPDVQLPDLQLVPPLAADLQSLEPHLETLEPGHDVTVNAPELAPEPAPDLPSAPGIAPEAISVAQAAEIPATPPQAEPVPAPGFGEADLPAIAAHRGVALEALAAILQGLQTHLPRNVVAADIEAQVDLLLALVAKLAPATGEISDVARLKGQALESLRAGRLADADDVLAAAEDVDVRAAQVDMQAARIYLVSAAETRGHRAEIANLVGDYRRAIRHFAAAVRCVPQYDRRGRWQMLTRQGLVLIKLSQMSGDDQALVEAADVYTEAATLLSEREAPYEWISAEIDLAKLLTMLGTRQRSVARIQTALSHLKPAIEALARRRAMHEWAEAEVELGRTLVALNELDPSLPLLQQAAEAFRSALGVLSPDHTPTHWRSAQAALGMVLIELGEAASETSYLVTGSSHIEAAVEGLEPAVAPFDWARAMASLGSAQLTLAQTRNDARAYARAAGCLESAVHTSDATRHPLLVAEMLSELGLARWRLGEKSSDAGLLGRAAQAKVAALDAFEGAGQHERAEIVRAELEQLHTVMSALVRASANPAPKLQRSA